MANPQLPSFVELMASLGLQDEHAANALIRGAAAVYPDEVVSSVSLPQEATSVVNNSNPYRQSTASLDSSGTPLSSTSLVTPLSSPSVQRDRERPASHGKKRYSPYGLSAVANDPRDMYSRRGSVPDILSQSSYDRRLHHLSAPEPYHDLSSNSGRATDEDGDEEMEDATSARLSPVGTYRSPKSPSLHCAGQPNLLISRQRMTRPGPGPMPRTKSHSHMRTTSIGASQQQQQRSQQPPQPPMPMSSPRMEMSMDTERTNVNDAEGDIAVISISSLLRRSHPTQQQQQQQLPRGSHPSNSNPNSTVSLDSPRGFHFPAVPSLPPPQPPSATAAVTPSTSSDSLRPPSHRAPPSAPPTKTSFGFLPGASLSGNITATSLSAARRARHARSSSARSVREMIRERESNVLLAPLHSFHPMGETEEEGSGDTNLLKPSESRIRHRSTGDVAPAASATAAPVDRGITPPSISSSQHSSHSFLPLDDSTRSFSQRRRVKRSANDATTPTSTSARPVGKRSSPPPPLMLPTLPISFNIRALVGAEREGDKDRLAVGGGDKVDGGYVSRREPHSPDPRGSWGRRRVAPLEVAGV